MKASLITTALLLGLALLPSCENLSSLSTASPSSIGALTQLIPGTVVAATPITFEANNTDKSLGTNIGATVGATGGSLIGRGKGRVVATAGLGIAGAVIGRTIAAGANKIAGQELTIEADNTKVLYKVRQPVYEELGAITVGTHGNLEYGSSSRFLPDGH